MIYAIQSGEFVKIGFSDQPDKRLGTIRISSPIKCTMIGLMEGGIGVERQIHSLFSSIRVEGEWFKLTQDLRVWIDSNMRPAEEFFPNINRTQRALSQTKANNNSPRLSARLQRDAIEDLNQYCQENNVSKSVALRIAIERLCDTEPTKSERSQASYQIGRPSP